MDVDAECICWPIENPTTYAGIVEPGGALEPNPECGEHFPGVTQGSAVVQTVTKRAACGGGVNVPGFSRGGYTPGTAMVTQERVEDCECGLPLYRIDGGPAEHIITPAMWATRAALATWVASCPILWNTFGPHDPLTGKPMREGQR